MIGGSGWGMNNSQKVLHTPPFEPLMGVLEHGIATVVEELAGNVLLRVARQLPEKVAL
jgi:hypothetical protein